MKESMIMSKKSKSVQAVTKEEFRINQDMIDIAKSDPETIDEVSNMTGLSVEEITGEYSKDLDENGNEIQLDEPAKKKPGIGKFIVEQILTTTKTNTEILNEVLTKFESKTTMACIAWYKSKLRKEGKIPVRTSKPEVKTEVIPA
jgi:hypothetical protein